ncbi:HERC2 [Symbiodinium sp. CCMP2456]|nr:HERC2 [Symbiodinium sp. CCMP2456]
MLSALSSKENRKRPDPQLLRLGAEPLEALLDLGLEPGPALSHWLGPPWPKHHRGFALVRGGEILATTRAALTSQYPACLAELSSASEETPQAHEYMCFFQFNLAHDSDWVLVEEFC